MAWARVGLSEKKSLRAIAGWLQGPSKASHDPLVSFLHLKQLLAPSRISQKPSFQVPGANSRLDVVNPQS